MREVVLDTETTGLDPKLGHRIVEIGCIELVDHIATGRRFHAYVNPECPVPAEAYAIHGLGNDFLGAHPPFAGVVDDFLAFLADSPLVIHNAAFDLGFLNGELARLGRPAIASERARDTVMLARTKFPGAQASLEALCRRFGIDQSARTKHGALVDAELLAAVYLELVAERQSGFELAAAAGGDRLRSRNDWRPRQHAASADELAAHAAFIQRLKQPIWRQ